MRYIPIACCVIALAFPLHSHGQIIPKNVASTTTETPKFLLTPLDNNSQIPSIGNSGMIGHYTNAPSHLAPPMKGNAMTPVFCMDSEKINLMNQVKALEDLKVALEEKIKILETNLARRDEHK